MPNFHRLSIFKVIGFSTNFTLEKVDKILKYMGMVIIFYPHLTIIIRIWLHCFQLELLTTKKTQRATKKERKKRTVNTDRYNHSMKEFKGLLGQRTKSNQNNCLRLKLPFKNQNRTPSKLIQHIKVSSGWWKFAMGNSFSLSGLDGCWMAPTLPACQSCCCCLFIYLFVLFDLFVILFSSYLLLFGRLVGVDKLSVYRLPTAYRTEPPSTAYRL
jgi:hypothetical protein